MVGEELKMKMNREANYEISWSQFGIMRRDLYNLKAEKTLISNIYFSFVLKAWDSRKTRFF